MITRVITVLLATVLLGFADSKKKEKTYKMEIYGDCYFYHMPTYDICNPPLYFSVGFRDKWYTEFYTIKDKNGKVKYNVKYIWCKNKVSNKFYEYLELYIYMTPEDIKQCNQKQ